MAVPKRKTTPSRRGMRRAHDALGKNTYIEDNGAPYIYTYTIYRVGTSGNEYSFCNGTAEMVVAFVIAGSGVAGTGCSGYP